MSPRRRQPYYFDAEPLGLIEEHLADWILVEDDHLTAEQKMEKWEARGKAKQDAAIATARDGNYWPLIRGWREECWTLSEEAEQLIAERLTGGAKRSHRRGPAHGIKYSPNHEPGRWVPAIREILRVFYPVVPERERATWAVRLAAQLYEIDETSFIGFWARGKRPPSVIAGDDLARFREYLVHQRTLYLEHIEESRNLFPRTFADPRHLLNDGG